MLVPAGILIVMMLGGIAVDSAVAFNARQRLDTFTGGLANDVVTLAIPRDASPGGLQAGSDLRPNAEIATRLVSERGAQYELGRMTLTRLESHTEGNRITIVAEATVPLVFSDAIPGVRSVATVRSSATAELRVR